MEYTKLGHTGLEVSRLCLGCMGFGDAAHWFHKWVLDEENSRPIIKHALDLGINFFDTANVYSLGVSEESSAAGSRTSHTATRWSSPPRFTAQCAKDRTAAGSHAKLS
jgi:aryl-alcohol dehydrogenase-like predicted oxidoreductase